MKALFLGHTGINKRQAVHRLASHRLAEVGLPDDLDNIRSRDFLRVFHLEDEISKSMNGNYIPFLDQFYATAQFERWTSAWNTVLGELNSSGSTHTLITLHATYFRQNRFFSTLNLELLQQFHPNFIVTLIEDVQDCWFRITEREKQRAQGTELRLRDILLWRTVEIMTGDFLAKLTNAPHYVVAVKHPVQMVDRLLFAPHPKRVYASFPISSTRNDVSLRALIDRFRKQLHERFVVFDPLTIDERAIRNGVQRQTDGQTSISISAADRWPLAYPAGYVSLVSPDDVQYPLELPTDQVKEVLIDIDRQIRARDYRLIDQANLVAAFRPSMNGHHSRGVSSELQYAAQTVGIPVHVVWNTAEDGDFGDSPFSSGGVQHATADDLLKAID